MFNQTEFVAHSSLVTCLSIGGLSQNILATGGEDCIVHVWNSEARNIWKLSGNKSAIECVTFNPNEEYVASGARSGSIKIFDISEGRVARNLRGHQTCTNSLYYHPHADILLSGSEDTQVKAWDLRNKDCLMTCPGHDKLITCVRFSPDGRWLVTSGQDGKVIFWDVVAGKIIHTISCSPGSYALQLEFSPTELYFAISTSARVCLVYDCENNFELIVTTPAESSQLRRICFSDQGRCLHVATEGNLRVYELPNNQYYRSVSDGAAASFSCLSSMKVNWDKVSDMRLNETNSMIAGCFNANFVSLHSGDLNEICGENGEEEYPDDEMAAKPIESKDSVQATPPRRVSNKVTSSPQTRLTTASDSKITTTADEDEYVQGNVTTDAKEAKFNADEEAFILEHQVNNIRLTPSKKKHPDADVKGTPTAVNRGSSAVSANGRRIRTSDSARGKPTTGGMHARYQAEVKQENDCNFAVVGNKHQNAVDGDMNTPKRNISLDIGGKQRNTRRNELGSVNADTPLPLIGKLLDNYLADGKEFSSKLSHRTSSLRILQQYWNSGDISQVISEVQLMYESNRALTLTCRNSLQGNMLKAAKDKASYVLDEDSHQMLVHESQQPIMIIADFLTCVDGFKPLLNNPVGGGLTLDVCVTMLPILDNMLNDASLEHVIRASVRATTVLCESFGDMISSVRNNISIVSGGAGVDLSREERTHKCNLCYVELKKVYNRVKSLLRAATTTAGVAGRYGSSGGGKKYSAGTLHDMAKLESRLSQIIV